MAVQKRGKVVRVLLTEAEHRELQRAAERASLPVAVFARVAMLEKTRSDVTDAREEKAGKRTRG